MKKWNKIPEATKGFYQKFKANKMLFSGIVAVLILVFISGLLVYKHTQNKMQPKPKGISDKDLDWSPIFQYKP
ncbi:MAG TPA: hypothetical protein VLE69_03770 [Candidatus Saccharimonadales bacterium]|nr:hypothetical protein [Candidatus Saccharimonadales bacterium]